ncbi:transmembrane protease serine 9-like [Pholidichthys leucotaenia]
MFCLRGFRVFILSVTLLSDYSGHCSEIIGGKEVKPHSLPFMALLMGKDNTFCGGILISPEWILTAAHCLKIEEVLLGVHSIKQDEKESRQVRSVKNSFLHDWYCDVEQGNDIMLIKLDKKVKQTKTVEWLEMTGAVKDPPAGSRCLVAGWGRTQNYMNEGSDVLMSVNVTVIDRAKCNSRKHYDNDPVITTDMICAGSDRMDTCEGDSGGPLLCDGVLTGVTSFGGTICGSSKHPGVYSFLSAGQLTWIRNTVVTSFMVRLQGCCVLTCPISITKSATLTTRSDTSPSFTPAILCHQGTSGFADPKSEPLDDGGAYGPGRPDPSVNTEPTPSFHAGGATRVPGVQSRTTNRFYAANYHIIVPYSADQQPPFPKAESYGHSHLFNEDNSMLQVPQLTMELLGYWDWGGPGPLSEHFVQCLLNVTRRYVGLSSSAVCTKVGYSSYSFRCEEMVCLTGVRAFILFVALLTVYSGNCSKIIGGKEVEKHSMRFMAWLTGDEGDCGGILISPEWVLTAAHCRKIKKVFLGVHSTEDDKDSSQVRRVKNSFHHDWYCIPETGNDLMLLKLDKKVKKTKTVEWLELSKAVKDPAAGSKCLVAGWGRTKHDGEESDVLMSVNVTVIDRAKCNSHQHYDNDPVITTDMICAGSDRADTCEGDSGGPLLCNGVLTAVVSFGGKICGTNEYPGVYSLLSDRQLKWIKKTMNAFKMS